MNAPVANSSICTRSMAERLNSQSNCAQGLTFAEAGLADAMGDAAFPAAVRLFGEEPVQELLMRQAVAHRLGQHRVELLDP